ncbi:unnamed protein product [Owenia fusiformis]|uniref:B30.2/SPRY domain-containing protein n=1 Tax=Owenia fusiformis TaxID=6347 RepID=A0A8S4NME9_OWEFU|nr:unnamed protein product [Owenia fusiformis]
MATSYSSVAGNVAWILAVIVVLVLVLLLICLCCTRMKRRQKNQNTNFGSVVATISGSTYPVNFTHPDDWLPLLKQVFTVGEFGFNPAAISRGLSFPSDQEGTLVMQTENVPNSHPTHGARGKLGFLQGKHVWEIIWPPECRGYNATVGIGTVNAALYNSENVSLVGFNLHSWGWNLTSKCIIHCNQNDRWYPGNNDASFEVPEKFFVYLDMDEGILGFGTRDEYWGPAVWGLKGGKLPLFPMVGISCPGGHVQMLYTGSVPNHEAQLSNDASQKYVAKAAQGVTAFSSDGTVSNIAPPSTSSTFGGSMMANLRRSFRRLSKRTRKPANSSQQTGQPPHLAETARVQYNPNTGTLDYNQRLPTQASPGVQTQNIGHVTRQNQPPGGASGNIHHGANSNMNGNSSYPKLYQYNNGLGAQDNPLQSRPIEHQYPNSHQAAAVHYPQPTQATDPQGYTTQTLNPVSLTRPGGYTHGQQSQINLQTESGTSYAPQYSGDSQYSPQQHAMNITPTNLNSDRNMRIDRPPTYI